MAIAIRIWRVASWIVGCVFILPTALLIWMDIREYELRHPAAIALFGLYFLACLLAPISAIGIKRATWWARPVGWIAASVQTLAAPIFTPLGIFGLILLYCGAGKAGPRPESSRLWQRASTVPSTVIGMVVVMISIDLSFRWAKHLGYPDTPNLVITLLILWTCIDPEFPQRLRFRSKASFRCSKRVWTVLGLKRPSSARKRPTIGVSKRVSFGTKPNHQNKALGMFLFVVLGRHPRGCF